MTKILSFDGLREDEWKRSEASIDVPRIVKLEDLATNVRGDNLALEVSGEVEPDTYAEHLERLAMVVIRFPAMKDGRGFSAARELRERYGYQGVLRAAGTFIPDQIQYLARVGFDEFELPDDGREATYARELYRFSVVYQKLPGDGRFAFHQRI